MSIDCAQTQSARTPDETRSLAYHEAGHASMHLFFGTCSHLCGIDMRGDEEQRFDAFVRQERMVCMRPGTFAHSPRDLHSRRMLRCNLYIALMHYLAGLGAEHRAGGGGPSDWLFAELARYAKRPDVFAGTDIEKASKATEEFRGRIPLTMLCTARDWLNELFAHSRFWRVVDSLAMRLMGLERMDGREAEAVMVEAWGDCTPPLFTIGYKWRRRFHIVRATPARKRAS
jgi:hypothetical protein